MRDLLVAYRGPDRTVRAEQDDVVGARNLKRVSTFTVSLHCEARTITFLVAENLRSLAG